MFSFFNRLVDIFTAMIIVILLHIVEGHLHALTLIQNGHGFSVISINVACITPVLSKITDINITYNPCLIVML